MVGVVQESVLYVENSLLKLPMNIKQAVWGNLSECSSRLESTLSVDCTDDIMARCVENIVGSIFIKWSQYKRIYRFNSDELFKPVLDGSMNDVMFHQSIMKQLPLKSFMLVVPKSVIDCAGMFVHVEFLGNVTYLFVNKMLGGENGVVCYPMRLEDNCELPVSMLRWLIDFGGNNVDEENLFYIDEMRLILKVVYLAAYHLSSSNVVVTEGKLPGLKKIRVSDGSRLSVKQWSVDYRAGCNYDISALLKSYDTNSNDTVADDGCGEVESVMLRDRPKPHVRAGHRRNQPYGPGRKLRKPIWIGETYVNGTVDDIITTEHSVRE